MRNLRPVHHCRIDQSHIGEDAFICVDVVNKQLYHVDTKGIWSVETAEDNQHKICWVDEGISTSRIIAANFVSASDAVCVVTREGDVVLVDCQTWKVEIVGCVTDGVLATQWSPDEELLVLVTAVWQVIVMTADFEPVHELALDVADFGEQEFVNVGWGKKKTQFHGSVGKMAAHEGQQVSGAGRVEAWDDRQPRVTWRGDGSLFAVGYVGQRVTGRQFRVISREGVLQATGECPEGLEQSLAWKPSGGLIASSQRLSHKHQVVFFEKNGLRHGDFDLSSCVNNQIVREVAWNLDSSVLLVWLQELTIEGVVDKSINRLQLWMVGNYHWYLKQQVVFGSMSCFLWDPEEPLKLHVLSTGWYDSFCWVHVVDSSTGESNDDLSQVAIIDGTHIKVTPLKLVVVPPPSSAYVITLPDPAIAVMFPSNVSGLIGEESDFVTGCNSNDICIIHGLHSEMSFYKLKEDGESTGDEMEVKMIHPVRKNQSGGSLLKYKFVARMRLDWSAVELGIPVPATLANWTWITADIILASFGKFLAVIQLFQVGLEMGRVFVKVLLPMPKPVISVCPALALVSVSAVLQFSDGELFHLNLNDHLTEPWKGESGEAVAFPIPCQCVSLCVVKNGPTQMVVPLGLTSRHRLFAGSQQLMAGVTSLCVQSNHLLVTTTGHQLLVIPLQSEIFTVIINGATNHVGTTKEDFGGLVGSRRVERGSKLVLAMAGDTRVVLQMPRGNLEVVSPRPLVVYSLQTALMHRRYRMTLDIMRTQRIDTNLIYDHDPLDFLAHVKKFVADVGDPQRLDLFLATLSKDDVTKSMYAFNYRNRGCTDTHPQSQGKIALSEMGRIFSMNGVTSTDTIDNASDGKINLICSSVRETMSELDAELFLLPILTSYVKMVPSQMETALALIQSMKADKEHHYKVSADEGLRHLLYIADANELYDVALGTYDFDLVMTVANRSQKDPKEYLPFLNELRALEFNYQHFRIDTHLRRYNKALESASKVDDCNHEEVCKLIETHRLYADALQVFPSGCPLYQRVCLLFGNHLIGKRRFAEAAVTYARAGLYQLALESYRKAGNWKQVLVMASMVPSDARQHSTTELCLKMAEDLRERGNFLDASRLYECYLEREEDAVDCLVLAAHWDDAMRVAVKFSRTDLIETQIRPGITEQFRSTLAEVVAISDTFRVQCERLATVRELRNRLNNDNVTFLDENLDSRLDSDLYSESSTVITAPSNSGSKATNSSSSTYRSSKNRRKLERKKYSTREGGAAEDLGLVSSLHQLISRADHLTVPVSELVLALTSFGLERDAQNLQGQLQRTLTAMGHVANRIWPETNENSGPEFGPQMTTEGVVAAMQGGNGAYNISAVQLRLMQLEPHLRHPPPPTRNPSWYINSLYFAK